MSQLRNVIGAKEFRQRVINKLKSVDENIKEDDLYLYKCKAIGMYLVGDSYKKSSEKLKVQPISIMDFDTLPYLENTP